MILADTNIWIRYFNGKADTVVLSEHLSADRIVCHEWVIGELQIGNLGRKRDAAFADLNALPRTKSYPIFILTDFIERERLYGRGLSLVDAQLLYAAIAEDHELWTADKTLRHFAKRYGVVFAA